jgi:hypothetical protein
MGIVLIQTSAIIANCRDSFEMNRVLPGLYRDEQPRIIPRLRVRTKDEAGKAILPG